ncbi:putative mis12-mtw1 family protein [Erysiphe neolycopersici]|uniref:Putative mis12-mtw1 family protein n=1 Tax=Erysiphe neolycopersici TaxID=212602 RepID=A0A420HT84_9PEZI|nr:putative mis12-mtw1 family protein [Erysiphe neolycopersici]
MTTILWMRYHFEVSKMSQTAGRRRSKRLATYDEEDGDFVFTRASKRIKAQSSEPEVPPVITTKRSRKPRELPEESDFQSDKTALRKVKESKTYFSTPKSDNDGAITTKRISGRLSARKAISKEKNIDSDGDSFTTKKAVQAIIQDHTKHKNKPTIIPLPLSDTPIINRNKEFRNKARESNRRSSLGLRGRRASSLIDSGHSAIPHQEVEIHDFYKYIEAEGLSEPRRMKQLLIWTGERCIGRKISGGSSNSAAELAARHVKEALLNDFANKSEYSDWFNREEVKPTQIVKKQNPRNLELEENIVAVEARLKILREERDKWKELAKRPPKFPVILPDAAELEPSHIDASLLDPEQANILAEASSSSASDLRNQISQKLKKLQSMLEFEVDQFADGVHKLERYQETIDRVADRILSLSAKKLEELDRKKKEQLGTRDLSIKEVLRSLSRILPE